MSGLPAQWAAVTLGDLIDRFEAGRNLMASGRPAADGEYGVLKISAVSWGRFLPNENKALLPGDSPFPHETVCAGDLLISRANTTELVGAPVLVESDHEHLMLPDKVLRICYLSDAVDPRYLTQALRSQGARRYIEAQATGTSDSMRNLSQPKLREIPIPLAPRAEQQRIADKLDALLARVDVCRERLDRVPGILWRFRESVLSAATGGELTADWRRERSREFRWDECALTDLGELGRGKSKHRPRNDPRLYGGPYPFIQTGAVAQSGGFIREHAQSYSELGLAQSRLWPAGTLCITIAANIADTAVLTYPACFPDSVVGFVADKNKCLALFVKWSVDSIRERLEAFAPATAQKNINLDVLRAVRINVPSLDEQAEIVRRVESLFALADAIEEKWKAARAKVERLTPALLAKAFRGELVPQDPNDEPASALLTRIQAERTARPNAKTRGRRAATPTT